VIETRHRASFDAAISHALLLRVARGELPETLRTYRPAPTVAFGRRDALAAGFGDATAAARACGFAPMLRSAGGRPAAYDEDSVLFDLVMRSESPLTGAQEAFARSSEALAAALRDLGVDARVGPVPGEYCRGDFSLNAGGAVKIGGTAQRRIAGATLLAGFVTVAGADRLRAVLVDVYAALGIAWEPSSLGALEDLAPDLSPDAVERAVAAALGLAAAAPDDATLALAAELEPRHAIAAR
jgi:octanoyl-[GcvH]:protein N-octanoyltransferase